MRKYKYLQNRSLLVSRILIIILISIMTVYGQDGQGGTESNLAILGYGARAMGLGKAYTALADDPTAVYWNPAGLEFLDQKSLTLFHTSLWEGTTYDFLGYAHPTLNLGTFGFGIARIGVGDIPQTNIHGLEIGQFSNEEYQVYFSYAKHLPLNITPGISVRMVRRSWGNLQNEDDLEDTGFAADIGVLFRPEWLGSPWFQDWSFGLKVNNLLSPQLKEGIEVDDFPMTIKLGLMKKIRFAGGEYFDVLMDIDYSSKRDLKLHLGSAYKIRNIGEVRLGYSGSGFALGAGVQVNVFKIDYAYSFSEYSDFLPGIHRISLSFDFGYTRDQLFEISETRKIEEQERLLADLRSEENRRFVTERLKIADTYFKSAKFFDAVVEYQQVLYRDSTNVYAQAMLDSSNRLLQRGYEQEQALAVKEAVDKSKAELDREFVDSHFERARVLLDQNKFSEALIELNLASERDPNNEMLVSARNTTQRRIFEESRRLITRSQEEMGNQNFSGALVLLSDARTLAGNNRTLLTEIDDMTKQVEIQRNIQKGLLLFQIKEYAKAMEVFEEILAIDPENVLVLDYHRRSKIETIGKDAKMDAATEKLYLDGMNEFLKGNYSSAIAIWEEILVEQPYNKKVLKAVQGAREKMEQ